MNNCVLSGERSFVRWIGDLGRGANTHRSDGIGGRSAKKGCDRVGGIELVNFCDDITGIGDEHCNVWRQRFEVKRELGQGLNSNGCGMHDDLSASVDNGDRYWVIAIPQCNLAASRESGKGYLAAYAKGSVS